MKLALTVSPPDADPIPVVVDFDELTAEDRVAATAYAGVDAMVALQRSGWEPTAAKALIYVLIRKIDGAPVFKFDDFEIGWGPIGAELDPDSVAESLTMEAGI